MRRLKQVRARALPLAIVAMTGLLVLKGTHLVQAAGGAPRGARKRRPCGDPVRSGCRGPTQAKPAVSPAPATPAPPPRPSMKRPALPRPPPLHRQPLW